jgi:hypothetical protein
LGSALGSALGLARAEEYGMHYDSHKNIIEELEARILTIRDSL